MENSACTTECVLTVSDLNRKVREGLEAAFPLLWIAGEISNCTLAASGHLYFSLKDDGAQVRCVVWRNKAQLLGWRPQNGQRVEARALVTLFEARGDYQLNVETLRHAGQGELFRRFLELKNRLEGEGLFDPSRKRPLPEYPSRIGIVTSPQAAALSDVLSTLRRRAPHIVLTLYPTPVQGEGAADRIAAAIDVGARDGNDVLILCRGGGSIEDLWAFNEEVVARALRASPVPVICGLGHETDFTIADFAADRRAPTPTAAAEMVGPERAALLARLDQLSKYLNDRIQRRLLHAGQRLDWLTGRLIHPAQRLALQNEVLVRLQARLLAAHGRNCEKRGHQLQSLVLRLRHAGRSALAVPGKRVETFAASLRQLDPLVVLERGYAVVRNEDGSIVRDAELLSPGQGLCITLAHGHVKAIVTP